MPATPAACRSIASPLPCSRMNCSAQRSTSSPPPGYPRATPSAPPVRAQVPATAMERLGLMRERIEAMIKATDGVAPALAKFVDLLDDDQRAKLDSLAKERRAALAAIFSKRILRRIWLARRTAIPATTRSCSANTSSSFSSNGPRPRSPPHSSSTTPPAPASTCSRIPRCAPWKRSAPAPHRQQRHHRPASRP